jgi:mannose-6-phosphate isomerase-like protein (cupin superfamily)
VTPPGGGTPPHVHRREDESFYILEGAVTFYTEGRVVVAKPGAFFFAPRNVPHHFVNQGSVPAKMIVVASPPGFEKFVEEAGAPGDLSSPPSPPTPEQIGRLVEIAARYGIEILPPG